MTNSQRVTWTASAILAMFDLQQLGMVSTSVSPVSEWANFFQNSLFTVPYILEILEGTCPIIVRFYLRISNVENHELFQCCSFKIKSSPPEVATKFKN